MDLFGNDTLPNTARTPKGMRKAEFQHGQLIAIHGETEGKKCKACVHCIYIASGGKRFYKCEIANPQLTGHLATDWGARWTACGKFKPETDAD
jgi:hypothetical protein